MNYPDKQALIDMALNGLEDELAYLRQRTPDMTAEQREAFVRICRNVAEVVHAD